MRIWSIHPKYLDPKGFVALWREALLAKNVLEGKTVGYRNHPQLERFKNSKNPLDAINQYLSNIYDESVDRHFNFNSTKFRKPIVPFFLTVSEGQIIFEFEHLLCKLKGREINLYNTLKETTTIFPHPMFKTIKGKIEQWERIKQD
jgi:hypothetical protein